MNSAELMLGLQGLILGLGSVFLVLFLLIIIISIMGKLVQNSEKKQIEPIVEKTISKEPVAIEDDEDEIIAAITAAIACMAQREGKKFKIRSYKRV